VLIVNTILGRAFDAVFSLLQPLPVTASLAVVSALTAAALLVVVRTTSNQGVLAATKRQIHADLLEIRLFNADLAGLLRAQRSLICHNITYLRLSFLPVLWAIIPLVIVVPQLEAYFRFRGIRVAQPILVTAQLEAPLDQRVELTFKIATAPAHS
jgi:hypothetical protein